MTVILRCQPYTNSQTYVIQSQANFELYNFTLTQFYTNKKCEILTFFKCAENFSVRELKKSETNVMEEYCWAITQVAQGVRSVMPWPIRCQCVGVWISTCLPCIYAYNLPQVYSNCELSDTRLAPDLQERNSFSIRGMSYFVVGEIWDEVISAHFF